MAHSEDAVVVLEIAPVNLEPYFEMLIELRKLSPTLCQEACKAIKNKHLMAKYVCLN